MMPDCPFCETNRHVSVHPEGGGLFICGGCRGMFDDDPNEGGTHHDRDVSRRLERMDERRERKLDRLGRRR